MKIKKCPRCRSGNITTYMGMQFGKYFCKKCGYVGALIFEDDVEQKTINSYKSIIKSKMTKKGEVHITTGFSIRIIAGFIIALSLPFLITNPSSPIAQGVFAFGNFLLVIGANVK